MDVLEGARIGDELPVEGIGKRRVEREEQRTAGGQDPVESRMFAALVSAHQRFFRQPESGEGNELGAFEPQETRGIARNEPSHRGEQPGIAVSRTERCRQIARDLEKNLDALGIDAIPTGFLSPWVRSTARPKPGADAVH